MASLAEFNRAYTTAILAGNSPAQAEGIAAFQTGVSRQQLMQEVFETPAPRAPLVVPTIAAPPPAMGPRVAPPEVKVGIRNIPNAFTVNLPGLRLPGGVSLDPFSIQIPRPMPRLPGPVPVPRGRLPIPIPIPIPWPGGDVSGGAAGCTRGFHLDKKTRSRCVRNRSMNPLNPRALKRALRRVDRFEDFVNKTAKLTGLRLAKKSTGRKKTCR